MILQKNKTQPSFVLLEVILSAIIAAFVGIVLLQSQANNTNLLRYIFEQENINKQTSFLIPILQKRDSASQKDLYELLNESGLFIDTEEMQIFFKTFQTEFSKSSYTQIPFFSNEIEDTEKQSNLQTKTISVNKIEININGKPDIYYSLEYAQ